MARTAPHRCQSLRGSGRCVHPAYRQRLCRKHHALEQWRLAALAFIRRRRLGRVAPGEPGPRQGDYLPKEFLGQVFLVGRRKEHWRPFGGLRAP